MESISNNIKGIIFDYGGTIDSRGVHWSWVIWDAYQACGINVKLSQFRDAYVFAERELARVRHILPSDNFYDLLLKKMRIELQWLNEQGLLGNILPAEFDDLAARLARHCYDAARDSIEEARPVLEALSERYPMMLVSNFYGNIDEVLRDFVLRHYFKGIIESAVVGVRKPNPTLFRLGVDALELAPEQVLVVGDSYKKDIAPAESLGCETIWIKARGWTDAEDTITHQHIITDIREIATEA